MEHREDVQHENLADTQALSSYKQMGDDVPEPRDNSVHTDVNQQTEALLQNNEDANVTLENTNPNSIPVSTDQPKKNPIIKLFEEAKVQVKRDVDYLADTVTKSVQGKTVKEIGKEVLHETKETAIGVFKDAKLAFFQLKDKVLGNNKTENQTDSQAHLLEQERTSLVMDMNHDEPSDPLSKATIRPNPFDLIKKRTETFSKSEEEPK